MFMFGLFEGKYIEQKCCASITSWDVPWRDFFHGWDHDKRIMAIYEEGTTCSHRSMCTYICCISSAKQNQSVVLIWAVSNIRHAKQWLFNSNPGQSIVALCAKVCQESAPCRDTERGNS